MSAAPVKPKIRLYVDHPLGANAPIELSGDQAHYLRNVMRLGPGDGILLFNGREGEWAARIETLDRRLATVTPERQTKTQTGIPTGEPDLWLVFAPLKKARIDYIAQKATELGTNVILPAYTQRTAVSRVNIGRLRTNAIEAAEQTGRLTVPEVREAAALDRLLADWPMDRRILLCDETGGGPPIADALAPFAGKPPDPWAVMVGPEGGYAPGELDALGKLPIVIKASLGSRILRADTAAVAALACWQAILGDWRDQRPE